MDEKAFQEIMKFAIEKEDEAATFYEEAAKRSEKPHMKEAFADMAKEEQRHKGLLEKLDVTGIEQKQLKKIPDLKISEYLVDMEYSPDMEYRHLLVLAMKREEKALGLYNELAEKADDADMEKLFRLLAQEESKHKLRLEKEWDDLAAAEDV